MGLEVPSEIIKMIEERLEQNGLLHTVIFSVDPDTGAGMIDVLPENATKADAAEFIREELGFDKDATIFSGDSGNDLPAITSGTKAVLVKNTPERVKNAALDALGPEKSKKYLHIAKGNFGSLNGNFSAGVLEGLAHFYPFTKKKIFEPENIKGEKNGS